MACSDKGRGRRSMPEEIFNPITDVAVNSNIRKGM